MYSEQFTSNLNNLSCRRIIEENHSDTIIQVLEEKPNKRKCRYVASIAPTQVNIYDNEEKHTGIGFYAHYVVEKTDYFKGGECVCGCWLYQNAIYPDDSVIAVATSENEIFLLSCIECRVVSVLSNPEKEYPRCLCVSPKNPNLLACLSNKGNLTIWDMMEKRIVFQQKTGDIINMCGDSDDLLLVLSNNRLGLLSLQTFCLNEVPPAVTSRIPLSNFMCLFFIQEESKWFFVYNNCFVTLTQSTFQIDKLPFDFILPEYINENRVSITRDHKKIVIAEHAKCRVVSTTGAEIGLIVDNFGEGAQTAKDQSSYRKQIFSGCVLHNEARYALTTEGNRVMRFNCLEESTKYVVHVIYPHPVEDMYVFYPSLNAEPLMYLHPKSSENMKKEPTK